MKTMKNFSCVQMKDEAQKRRARLLQGMSIEQRLDFFRKADEALRQRRDKLRRDLVEETPPGAS